MADIPWPAKSIKTLGLHYPMITFLTILMILVEKMKTCDG